jgi:hypothetical protein
LRSISNVKTIIFAEFLNFSRTLPTRYDRLPEYDDVINKPGERYARRKVSFGFQLKKRPTKRTMPIVVDTENRAVLRRSKGNGE